MSVINSRNFYCWKSPSIEKRATTTTVVELQQHVPSECALWVSAVSEALRSYLPLSPSLGYRGLHSRRVQYHRPRVTPSSYHQEESTERSILSPYLPHPPPPVALPSPPPPIARAALVRWRRIKMSRRRTWPIRAALRAVFGTRTSKRWRGARG